MVRLWTRLGLAAGALAGCALLSSSTVGQNGPTVDKDVERQLTVAAGALLQHRSHALVHHPRDDHETPAEVLGVRISPSLVRLQEKAVRELKGRNRAPVEGGPAYTGARTRLEAGRAVRAGDRITLEVTEHTEVRYGSGKLTQSVRRQFEFTSRDEQITLVGERVLDPGVHPLNDPADR